MQNKNRQARFFSSSSLVGREARIVFKIEKSDSMEISRTVNEGAEKDSHTREKINDAFEGVPIDKKITAWIPALRGNFNGIKEAEAALRRVREATEQDICVGGVSELSKKAANDEIDCVKYTGLVNQLLKKGAAVLRDVPDGIDYSNDPNHHIAVYKFPKANMIGAKWTSNNLSS